MLSLVVELHVKCTGADDDKSDDATEEDLGTTSTLVHAILLGLELSFLVKNLFLDFLIVHEVLIRPACGGDGGRLLLVNVVQMAALSGPVQHGRADRLEEVDCVAVVAAIRLIVHSDGRVEAGADIFLNDMVPVEEASGLFEVVIKILSVVRQRNLLTHETNFVLLLVDRDVIAGEGGVAANL